MRHSNSVVLVGSAVPCSTLQIIPAVPAVPKLYSTRSTHSTLQYPPVLPQYPTATFTPCSTRSTHSTLQYPRVLPQYPDSSTVPAVPAVPCSTPGQYPQYPDCRSTHGYCAVPARVTTMRAIASGPQSSMSLILVFSIIASINASGVGSESLSEIESLSEGTGCP